MYYSITGNVRRFVQRIGLPFREIAGPYEVVDEPYIIVTPTTGFGQVPEKVDRFIRYNADEIRGVAVSGNRNWGRNFGAAGEKIAEAYAVPLLLRFELSGTDEDVRKFNEEVTQIGEANAWRNRA
ncbi:class Ib ribonucleoside-diphosphate reductase assembly flavoprotein NrdI [Paenibacillus sp. J5C2022]|uniref:class Ib ribonucleoside-diphosphate reductase assembly flavoprotein NrdI n=1 Tax=Paenibacillus sp. J5C2022 TaxID=2977129 RepID=UPI00293E6CDD|nr:class Ib ribonucleoside-diphosphate reductase assembly flavoprotein NrdI [Paenibacillus sp. J5C2022]